MSNSSNMQSSDVSATVREAFNFIVDKFPLFGPDNMKTDQYDYRKSKDGKEGNALRAHNTVMRIMPSSVPGRAGTASVS